MQRLRSSTAGRSSSGGGCAFGGWILRGRKTGASSNGAATGSGGGINATGGTSITEENMRRSNCGRRLRDLLKLRQRRKRLLRRRLRFFIGRHHRRVELGNCTTARLGDCWSRRICRRRLPGLVLAAGAEARASR